MKAGKRLVLFILALLGLIFTFATFSLWFEIPGVTPTIRNFVTDYPWAFHILTGFAAALLLFFIGLLVYAIFAKASAGKLVMKDNSGDLKISKAAVEGVAENAIRYLTTGDDVEVKAYLKKNIKHLELLVKVYSQNTRDLSRYGQQIQEEINAALMANLGVAPKEIRVRIQSKEAPRPVTAPTTYRRVI